MRVWNPELPGWDPERDSYAFMLTRQEDGSWEQTAVKSDDWINVIEGLSSWRDQPVKKWKRGRVGQLILDYAFQVEVKEQDGLVSTRVGLGLPRSRNADDSGDETALQVQGPEA